MMDKQQKLFVSGIGTDVGKTVVASILVEALQADYWKPIQAGLDEKTDSQNVPDLAVNHGQIFDEKYRLKTPMSPDASATREGVEIALEKLQIPDTKNHLIVEGAGGLLVPLNNRETILDLIAHFGLPTVLVSRHYLGSINHTLLSIEALKSKKIKIELLVFIGDHPETEKSILKHSGIKKYIKIPETNIVDSKFIATHAIRLFSVLYG